MKDILSVRASGEAKEHLKQIAAYIGEDLGTKVSSGQALEIIFNRALKECKKTHYDARFFQTHTEAGWSMDEEGTREFVKLACREEARLRPGIYAKAVQASCHSLGFDPDWVEGVLWGELKKTYLEGDPVEVSIRERDLTRAELAIWERGRLLPVQETESGSVVYAEADTDEEVNRVDLDQFSRLRFSPERQVVFHGPSREIRMEGFPRASASLWRALCARLEELGWH